MADTKRDLAEASEMLATRRAFWKRSTNSLRDADPYFISFSALKTFSCENSKISYTYEVARSQVSSSVVQMDASLEVSLLRRCGSKVICMRVPTAVWDKAEGSD